MLITDPSFCRRKAYIRQSPRDVSVVECSGTLRHLQYKVNFINPDIVKVYHKTEKK